MLLQQGVILGTNHPGLAINPDWSNACACLTSKVGSGLGCTNWLLDQKGPGIRAKPWLNIENRLFIGHMNVCLSAEILKFN